MRFLIIINIIKSFISLDRDVKDSTQNIMKLKSFSIIIVSPPWTFHWYDRPDRKLGIKVFSISAILSAKVSHKKEGSLSRESFAI